MLNSFPSFSYFPCYPQANWALLVLIPKSVGLCLFRPLWVSPTNSPVTLGVSPAAVSTPTGVFNQNFEALFPYSVALGWGVCFAAQLFLPVYLCANVGPQGLPAAAWPTLLHNPPPRWVCQPPPCCESSLPCCPSPPLLPVWMNVSSLSSCLSDFHTV